METTGFAAHDAVSPLVAFSFERRSLRPNDVMIEILYCGVCHTDLHFARNHWGSTIYPVVPGHEIIGRIASVGTDARRFKAGDLVAVGPIVDSCLRCDQCGKHREQMCKDTPTWTYGARDRISGLPTYGGYAKDIIVRQEFVHRLPDNLDPSRSGPLVCAGITVYSPLREWKVGPESRVAVIGLGGLGHLGVKFAVALGANVTLITRSEAKAAAAKALGAHHVLVSESPDQMASAASSFDLILDTIPVGHDLSPYIGLLDVDGTLVIVGAVEMMGAFHSYPLLVGRRRIAGSASGGMVETQKMLDFCGQKNILPECEIIPMQQINEAFDRLERGDVPYRFVIDMASLKGNGA